MNESQVFTNALKFTSPADRALYLDQACAGNPRLRAGVEALLRAQASDPEFLERPPGPFTDTADVPAAAGPVTMPQEEVATDQPGIVFSGRYKLLEQIGEGGMGTVWMAQQTEPVKRPVAIKLIKEGMGSKAVLARFEAERQALALMDHPNIAKVHDAGTTPDGRPFFVMELVKGVPITKYCDEHHLTPRQRLELFVPVCHAVQHAHQKGAIHRDLKPSNVLVVLYDDKPVPKVIDFGVAKATGQQLTEQTLHTGFGAVVGTVEYMSPEQASFNQLDVDTRSDIYSLGVLLYELLTGSPPFSRKDLEKVGVLEMLRVIREQEPSKPSAKLSTAEGLPTLAANRGMEPAKLTRHVRGELDWIVMRALEKDRSRRYETANGLARDLQRYLADEVVEARPPSAGYRVRKFLRRNRGRVLAAVALFLSLVAGLTAVGVVKAQADRDRAAAETDRATREAWTTASVSAACREARERADEAWKVSDFPERMQLSTDAAVAALRRADEYVAGGLPSDATLAELAAGRRDVDELTRHTRLITAHAASMYRFADDYDWQHYYQLSAAACRREAESLRQFGLDPINGPADEVARIVAASPIRDNLLGMLLWWHARIESLFRVRDRDPERVAKLPAAELAAANPADQKRLWQVIRSARQLCGGPYTRWQDLRDRNDVAGLVAFAASPDGLRFRSSLVGELGRDLRDAEQPQACRTFLRAAVDRYPHDVWLHHELAVACLRLQPPDHNEALRHMSAASALRSDSGLFHLQIGRVYFDQGANDHAVAAYRKAIALNGSITAHIRMGYALLNKKDWDGAVAAFREAARLGPDHLRLHVQVGGALMAAGRHAEGRQAMLDVLQRYPARTDDSRSYLRYEVACWLMKGADGRGATALPPAEQVAYRKQALDLMTAEVAAYRKLAATDRAFVHRTLLHLLRDEDFASVRDPKALEQLPPDERAAWAKLWADIRELRDATAPARIDKR